MKTNFTKLLLKASQPLKTSPLGKRFLNMCAKQALSSRDSYQIQSSTIWPMVLTALG
jgi:hypothetical protein